MTWAEVITEERRLRERILVEQRRGRIDRVRRLTRELARLRWEGSG